MKIAIIGANSRIAKHVIVQSLDKTNSHLNLFLRSPEKLDYLHLPPSRVDYIQGDANSLIDIRSAIHGCDIVFVSLEGRMDLFAKNIVQAMEIEQRKRLILISSVGSLNEVKNPLSKLAIGIFKRLNPGYIEMHQRVVKIIESSSLDYTIIRPGSLTNSDKISYRITHRNDSFKGFFVSRKSIATVVVSIFKHPQKFLKDNIGVAK